MAMLHTTHIRGTEVILNHGTLTNAAVKVE